MRGSGPERPVQTGGDRICRPVRRDAARCWALLLARIYECLPLQCPRCGEPMRVIAFILEPPVIQKILTHVGDRSRRLRFCRRGRHPRWKWAMTRAEPAAPPGSESPSRTGTGGMTRQSERGRPRGRCILEGGENRIEGDSCRLSPAGAFV